MPGIESLFAGSAPQAQPVQNVPTLTNDLINQQVMNQARQAQTAGAAQDMQLKQRGMQLSMLAGLDNILDPDKRAEAQPHVIAMANKLNPSYQIDPSIDESTRRALIMSGVPVEQQPQYGMMQQQAGLLGALRDRLTGQPAQPSSAMAGGMPSPAAQGPMASPGSGNSLDGAPGSLTDPNTMALMAVVNPNMATALANVQKTQYESPAGKGEAAKTEAQGKNIAEAQKRALEANEGYQQVAQTIDSLERLINDPNLPELKDIRSAKTQAELSQRFPFIDDKKAADAYNTFSTINESETINAIRDLASTGQIRMTRTLESIINKGYLIDPDASQKAKLQQAHAIKTELKNSAIAAQNVSSQMSGGATITYGTPYPGAAGQLPAQMQPQPGNAASQAQGALKQPAPQTGTAIDTPEAIKAAFNAGKLTKEQAVMMLKAKHGFE